MFCMGEKETWGSGVSASSDGLASNMAVTRTRTIGREIARPTIPQKACLDWWMRELLRQHHSFCMEKLAFDLNSISLQPTVLNSIQSRELFKVSHLFPRANQFLSLSSFLNFNRQMLKLVQRCVNSNCSLTFNSTQRLFNLMKGSQAQGGNTPQGNTNNTVKWMNIWQCIYYSISFSIYSIWWTKSQVTY